MPYPHWTPAERDCDDPCTCSALARSRTDCPHRGPMCPAPWPSDATGAETMATCHGSTTCDGGRGGNAGRDGLGANKPEPLKSDLNIVFTGSPGPGNECVFVEAEDKNGRSLNAGEWCTRPDGLVELRIALPVKS